MPDAFWEARFRRLGHTGWADFASYAYDQQVRLGIVRRLVDENVRARGTALDYGCGTGDFARLLAARFDRVVGCDVSTGVLRRARALTRALNVTYQPVEADFPPSVDCILSVTVLQHVLNDAELRTLLERFRRALSPTGIVVALESFAAERRETPYMVLRTRDELRVMFSAIGLRERAVVELYHPTFDPTPSFSKYRSRFLVRVLNRLAYHGLSPARAGLGRIAMSAAARDPGTVVHGPSTTAAIVWGA